MLQRPKRAETEFERDFAMSPSRVWERHPRAVLAGLATVVALLLICAVELVLRRIIQTDVVYNDHLAAMRRYMPDPKAIKLVDPAPWVTDEHGIFVANPTMQLDANSQGYRMPEFDALDNGCAKIMFLGDSFTWGWTAEPISACFVDQVGAAGYSTINLGVPGAATKQYAAQAELYVPQLKPDVVAVMFYPGNDFEHAPPVRPGLKRWHVTNQTFLGAADEKAKPITFEEARRQHLLLFGDDLRSRLVRASLSTATSSFVLSFFSNQYEPDQEVYRQLERIKEICKLHDATFMLFLLPVRPEFRTHFNSVERSAELFADLVPYSPTGLGPEHYAPLPDAHFNNDGHLAVTKLVLQQLAAAGHEPSGTRVQSAAHDTEVTGQAVADLPGTRAAGVGEPSGVTATDNSHSVSISASTEQVPLAEAVKIIRTYSLVLPKTGVNGSVVVDSALLPIPKERIRTAAISLMRAASDLAEKESLAEVAKTLAFFQPNVGDTRLSLDQVRSDGVAWRRVIEKDMHEIELLLAEDQP